MAKGVLLLADDLAMLEKANHTLWDRCADLEAELRKMRNVLPERSPCSRCGRRDGLDAAVDDSMWARISGRTDGGGLLCLWCMDELAAEKGLQHVPVRLYFAGRVLFSTPVDEFTDLGWSDSPL